MVIPRSHMLVLPYRSCVTDGQLPAFPCMCFSALYSWLKVMVGVKRDDDLAISNIRFIVSFCF